MKIEKNLKQNYCWIPEFAKANLSHVYFCKEVQIDSDVQRAEIMMYASTLYQLYINGQYVSGGPIRSYPEFPMYDTYDIKEYLKPGKNVIAVNVAHHGMDTFHHLYNDAGFTAVGFIVTELENLSLNSLDGWKCRLSKGYKLDAQKFSFAIGPIQVFDARKEDDSWKLLGFTDCDEWIPPVGINLSDNIKFAPRSISQLTNEEVLPQQLLSANFNLENEDYYNVSITDTSKVVNKNSGQRIFAYTYLFSPRKQTVDFGCWWGEYFVNGERVPLEYDNTINFRQKGTMELVSGWNLFVFSVGIVKIHYELHLAFPRSCGVIPSVNQSKDDVKFKVTDILNKDVAKLALSHLDNDPVYNIAELSELKDKWSYYSEPEIPGVNSKFLSWIRFGEDMGIAADVVENIKIDKPATLIFDMGNLFLGRIFVEYDAPKNTKISIGHSEEMYDQRPAYRKNTLISSVEGQICAEGNGYMESFEPRGFRYLQLTVTDNDGPVTIKKIGIKYQVYPYKRQGAFECSDTDFNKLYEWGYRTLRLCSEDVITDCSSRERTLYGGDLLPEAATAMVTTGDLGVVKHSMEVLLESQDPETGWLQSSAPKPREETGLFDYPPLTLINASWYCKLTNDLEFAQRAYPVFHKMMAHAIALRDDRGLFSEGYRVFIAHGYMFKDGTVTAFNALMVRTFRAWSEILQLLNKAKEAEDAYLIADEINAALLKYLWNDELGFIDQIDKDGVPAQTSGVHANVWSELFADVDKHKWQKSFDVVQERMKSYNPYEEWETVSTYNSFYYLGALYKAGEVKYAEDSIRKIYSIMLENPTGTIWEHANPTKSLCHAWSTAPNFYFSTRILGVKLGLIEDTDLSKVTIAPEAETVTWAKGSVMHPLGKVDVDWKIDGDKLLFSYKAPVGAEVIITPKGSLANKQLIVQ